MTKIDTRPKAGTLARRRAEAVNCKHCGAISGARCKSPEGFDVGPHAVRIARSNGLLPTPRRGHYTRPSDSIAWTDRELLALSRLDGGVP